MDRREILKGSAGLGVLAFGGRWLIACTVPGPPPDTTTTTTIPGGYGPLNPPDANGVRLPAGFTSRIIGVTGQPVAGTGYVWHPNPDGGACFPAGDGGWIYVSNNESNAPAGSVSMVRFAPDGAIAEAGAILTGTDRNCAGGPTPWGTWLSCEEVSRGAVYECDPTGQSAAVRRPQLGLFTHEAAAVDAGTQTVYLTEDRSDGGFYRFRPASYPDLSTGVLEILTESDGTLAWAEVPDPEAASTSTRLQVTNTKRFNRAEGITAYNGSVYFATTGDNKVWRYTPTSNELSVVYDLATSSTPVLAGVDNVTHAGNGDLYVAEDGGDMQVVQVAGGEAAAVAQVDVTGSEITGPAFSPAGDRLYFSSQRNPGTTYEVTGPWRQT